MHSNQQGIITLQGSIPQGIIRYSGESQGSGRQEKVSKITEGQLESTMRHKRIEEGRVAVVNGTLKSYRFLHS